MQLKKVYLFIIFCIVLKTVSGQQYKIATFNIRYDNRNDSGNLWIDRKPYVAGLVKFHDFDIVGMQEVLKNQLDDLSSLLSDYDHVGVGRDDGKDKGEHEPVFFRKSRFVLLQHGDFWLSETPEKPGPGWDARLNRICTWVQLQDRQTKKKFYLFNVHFDHQGIQARNESSKLMLSKIKSIAGNSPVILTGDFNGDHQSQWYNTLATSGFIRDALKEVKEPYFNNGSFNSFGKSLTHHAVIDHIFISKDFTATKWGVLTDSYQGKYPSDHFPVMAGIRVGK